MNNKTLHQLYAGHKGKVSDKWQLYLTEYNRLLNVYREQPIRLLEIGIQNGGSLEIWSKYFSQALMLIGSDINPDCARLSFDDPRIGVIVGDVNRPDVREQITRRTPQFDIIIDDGSHRSSDIIKTFSLYFPLLADGGIFIVEDIHCSYWEKFEGGLGAPFSAITFFMRLADIINYKHWRGLSKRAEILQGFCWKYDCKIDDDSLSRMCSVEFINSMCVVRKAAAVEKNGDTRCELLFDEYRDKSISLLEIGIQKGSSLEKLSKRFSNASLLIGCDIDSAGERLSFDDPRIDVIVGDANYSETREQITRRTPQFDIIINNGSRESSDMIKTFASYFPLLADGGIFIVEGIHLGYRESFAMTVLDPFSAVNFFNRLVDILNYDHWGVAKGRGDILRSIFSQYNCHIDADLLSQVHSLEFINSLCVVRKAAAADNVLGRRIIGGTVELVTTGISQTNGADTYLQDQTFNPWTRLVWKEEELACVRRALEDAEQQQLREIPSGHSWQWMRFLREASRRIKMRMQKKG